MTSATTTMTTPAVERPTWPLWLRMLVPVVLFLPIAVLAGLPLLVPAIGGLAFQQTLTGVLVRVVFMPLALLGYLVAAMVLTRRIDRRPVAVLGLGLNGRALAGLACGIAVSVVLVLVSGIALQVLGWGRPDLGADEGVSLPLAIILMLAQAFLMQGIGEEILFRGYVLQTVGKGPAASILLAALVFAVPHLASSSGQINLGERLLYPVVAFGFAVAAGAMGVAFRSVWAAVGIHGGFHVGSYLAVSMGLGFEGPAAWILVAALFCAAGAVVVRLPAQRSREVRENGPYAPPATPSAPAWS